MCTYDTIDLLAVQRPQNKNSEHPSPSPITIIILINKIQPVLSLSHREVKTEILLKEKSIRFKKK